MHCRLTTIVLLFIFSFSAALPAEEGDRVDIQLSYLKLRIPNDNPLTVAKAELGKQLFFDPRLSRDNTISCASCHDPAKGWSNGKRYATGIGGQVGTRSVPSLVNAGFQQHQFWDGRAGSLEEQARQPIESLTEMDMKLAALATKLDRIEGYRRQFQRAFEADASPERITQAIASFVRTIVSGEAPHDRYRYRGPSQPCLPRQGVVTTSSSSELNCRACHQGPNFTDDTFHNIGVGMESPPARCGQGGGDEVRGGQR